MKFYSDSKYETEVQPSEVHQIGDYVNTEVSWNNGVSTNFPVSLYLKECSAQGQKSYKRFDINFKNLIDLEKN